MALVVFSTLIHIDMQAVVKHLFILVPYALCSGDGNEAAEEMANKQAEQAEEKMRKIGVRSPLSTLCPTHPCI